MVFITEVLCFWIYKMYIPYVYKEQKKRVEIINVYKEQKKRVEIINH